MTESVLKARLEDRKKAYDRGLPHPISTGSRPCWRSPPAGTTAAIVRELRRVPAPGGPDSYGPDGQSIVLLVSDK